MKRKIELFAKKSWFRIVFIVMGLGSLIWFLIRVIPKPSRVTYPCMKAAAPLASSFLAYIIGLGTFTLFMKKVREGIKKSKYLLAFFFLFIGLAVGIISLYNYTQNKQVNAEPLQGLQENNDPIGEGVGIAPGRVAWIHYPDAINENCPNSDGDYWYMNKNTNQNAVNGMLSHGLQILTNTTSDANAWDALFKYFNNKKGKGEVGYQSGEKFVIKINLNGVWGNDINANINTSPQICYAILDQLINVVGVAQSDIHIGDPSHEMNDATYDRLHSDFPNVKYYNYSDWESRSGIVFYSSDGEVEDDLPVSYLATEYLINIPVFKKHHRAGISVCSKNHFGSVNAYNYHYSLPCPEATGVATNGEYGAYRCFVDIMGHKDIGGKTILYLVDALWGSTNYSHPPIKFAMSPFNDDYPSSLFLSQDPVAIESVCFDFLYEEFDEDHPTEGGSMSYEVGPFPHFPGTDDFLHQAADPENWPDDIEYDPEKDGTILTSLGTHEHWNNSTDKQYSRNLGLDKGIELIKSSSVTVRIDDNHIIHSNIPNPFNDNTTIYYEIINDATVEISIYNMNGQLINYANMGEQMNGKHEYQWNGISSNGLKLPEGVYLYKIKISNNQETYVMSNKMIYLE